MKTSDIIFAGFLGMTIGAFVVSFVVINSEKPEKQNLEKLTFCNTIADKIGLDPNFEKPDFIKDCLTK